MTAALAVAAAGCGSAPAAMEDGDTADTARFELVMTRTDKDGRLVMSGSYDYVRRQGFMTAELQRTADAETATPTEVRYLGGRFYSQQEHEGKSYWVEEEQEGGIGYADEVIVPFPDGELDPKEALSLILVSGDEQERGREVVRGTPTTHYRVRLDPTDISRELGGRRLDEAAGPFTADVWADDADRVRRIRLVEEKTATLTYDFFDFGVEVDVERPPADEVITHAEFDKLTEPTEEELLELCMEEIPKHECEQMHKGGK